MFRKSESGLHLYDLLCQSFILIMDSFHVAFDKSSIEDLVVQYLAKDQVLRGIQEYF